MRAEAAQPDAAPSGQRPTQLPEETTMDRSTTSNRTSAATAVAKPSTYWGLSIIAFLCSFFLGAFGMYFSAQVNSRWDTGDVEGARKASRTALTVDLIGIAIGILFIVIKLNG